jgi:hypothetical protein
MPNEIQFDCIPLQKEAEDNEVNRICDPYDSRMPFYTKSTSEVYLNSFPEVTINLSYWVVNRKDGTSENPIDSLKIQESVEVLNKAYEPLKIRFKLKAYNSINDSLLYWTNFSKFSSIARKEAEYVDTLAINIYLPYRFTNFNNNLRGAQVSSRAIAINSFEYNTGILVHEIGHVFDLKHTHRAFKGKNCERVTRDSNNSNYNADCSGDFVTDTGAMRELNNNTTYISVDCNYMGQLTDCDGTPYQMGDAEIRNFMSYTLQHCRDRFTIGQMIRVREYLKNDPQGVVGSYIVR